VKERQPWLTEASAENGSRTQVKGRRSIVTLKNSKAGVDSHDFCVAGVEEAVACMVG
jgi:hypothetical protein